MKSLVNFFSVISLFFLFSALGFSQETKIIRVLVDTDDFAPHNESASVRFVAIGPNSDTLQDSIGILRLRDFVVTVDVGDTIIWEGASSSSDNIIVDITKIKRKKRKGTKIFKNRTICGEKLYGYNNEIVKTKVLKDTEGKEDYEYDICFKINNKGKTYKIDPKLRVPR